ncbi:hypothetical protein EMIHUDRAFT_448259 [Emiliania huxleyi CCMP1516]|uniref:Uncharacterized protein n=2 Tax=Emiliania huxleyi TaxID=2903 RepID=A0A0D3IUD7_EMIH1|nr:hypothetical protein EMIHUDRAFT_448259 [Emiliania huxleyi CCMP1516]EOD14872.1 hypothetical protein EMIHUDRAFT_448259 [Emiliania huxleyi CCMP1516]|eukprot:XP_005767301.1 hypothetical protein EMIHUDRAFT_448259 [Emiliania huxleyi CCMP1516]
MADAASRLFNTLFTTFSAVFLGFACVKLRLISPGEGDMKGFGFFVGQIVFPLLIFKTVATAQLEGMSLQTLLACSLGKATVVGLTFAATVCFYLPRRTLGDRILTASVFASFAMASNDFAIGFPVVDALYGDGKAEGGVDTDALVAGNALIGSAVFVPGVTVLFSIGEALKKKDERAGGGSDSSEAALIGGRWPEALSTARAILLNPVITMTLAGFAYKLAFGWTLTLRDSKMRLEFPHPLSDLLELLTAPFGMCALFLTGTSLRGLRVSLVSCLLVAMKVVVCAYVSYALAGSLVDGRELRGFSFLYGMIPTSSAPLLFAMRYSPASAELLASSILLGLETMVDTLSRVQLTTTLAAFACATLCLASLGGLALRDAWGGAGPQRALLLCYAATLVVYAAAMAAMSPLLDDGPCSRLLLGAVPSVLVYPNTLNEVCSAVKPRLDPATLHLAPNLAWNVLLLLTSCGLFAYGSTRPHAPRRSTAALPPTAHSSDSDHASDPAADVEARGRGCGGVAPGAAGGASRASLTASMRASSALPDGLVHGLAAFATLRFFLQCVNTLLVEFDSAVAGVCDHAGGLPPQRRFTP